MAFDRHFIGVRPDSIVEVRSDILREHDGPTLVHAIQALHGTRLAGPRRPDLRPTPALLERRYERFVAAGVSAIRLSPGAAASPRLPPR